MMNQRFFAIVAVMAALIALRLPAENCINISYGDNIICFTGDEQLDTQDKIDRALKAWQNDYDGQVILWRIASDYIKRY